MLKMFNYELMVRMTLAEWLMYLYWFV